MHSRATDWHTGASVSLDHSQQVLRGAGLCPPSAETPGGFTWSRLFLPCWSPSWYSWISRSQLWSSTGRSTSWRSGFFLFLLPYLKGLLQRTLPGSRGGCWSLSQVYMGTGGSTPESAGSSLQGTMWALGGSVPCPRVPRQCFEGVLSIFYSIFCPDKVVEEKKKKSTVSPVVTGRRDHGAPVWRRDILYTVEITERWKTSRTFDVYSFLSSPETLQLGKSEPLNGFSLCHLLTCTLVSHCQASFHVSGSLIRST